MRTSLRPLIAAALAAVLLAACGGSTPAGVAATVNGEEIPRDLVEQIVVAQMSGPQVPPEGDERDAAQADIQRGVLSTLIGVQIVAQLAEDRGIEVTDEDLDAAMEDQIDQAGGQEAFDEFLGSIGLSEDEFRELIVADLVRRDQLQAELSEEVTDEAVEAAYEAQLETNVNSRHILVDTEDEAEDILARLDDGEDFGDLAQELSTDEGSGAAGGDLGFASPDQFVPEFAQAIQENEPGEVVGPVETDFGFHVIEVLDPPPFDELEPQLRGELEQQAQTSPELIEAFEEAFGSADVAVDSSFGEWDAELGQVVDPDAVGDGGGQLPQGDPMDEGITEEELQQMLEDELGNVDAP